MLEDILSQGFQDLGLELSPRALEGYRLYYEHLEKVNQVMDLTAITGQEEVARLHFLDCGALLTLDDFRGKRGIDIGTGAGFPGLVLKIACPELELTLLDSLDKRIGFLRDCCALLKLEGVEQIHGRAEEIPEGYRQAFDFAFSRAVARLSVLCELCLPYVRPGGAFIAMKGRELTEELAQAQGAIAALGGRLEEKRDYQIPGTDIVHSALVIRKVADTPPKYPRRWAQIKKKPL